MSSCSAMSSPRANDGRKVQRSIRHFFSGPSSKSPATKAKAEGLAPEQRAAFPALEVVWAKYSSYPPWPALVCPDPVEGKRVSSDGGQVHVQFFDEQSSHAWVEVGAVEKFRGAAADSAMMVSVRKKGRWTKALTRAVKEAEVAEGMRAAKRRDLLVDHKNDEDVADDVNDNESDDDERRRPKKRRNRGSVAPKNSKSKVRDNDSETKENEFDEENNIVFCHDDPEEMSEYEKIRQKNIAERQRKFQELQLNEAKTRLSDSLNLTPMTKKARTNTSYRGLAVKKEKEQSNEPVRKSLRLQNIEAETGLKLPDKEPTMLHWTPPVSMSDDH